MMNRAIKVEAHSNAGVRFLRNELRAAMMFLRLAEWGDTVSRDRNRLHARQAYEALLRFSSRLGSLTSEESEEINAGIKMIKTKLEQLGEKV